MGREARRSGDDLSPGLLALGSLQLLGDYVEKRRPASLNVLKARERSGPRDQETRMPKHSLRTRSLIDAGQRKVLHRREPAGGHS